MSHENTNNIHQADDKKPTVPFRSSLVFVVFLIALFVAAVNFIDVMGHDADAGHGGGHTTEAAHHDAAADHGDHEDVTSAAHRDEDEAGHDDEHHDDAATGDDHGHGH